NCL
ncbi:ABC transporter ATP-binding protein uup, partial [Haemophilus influenzae]